MIQFIDTHTHLDGEEYNEDRDQVVQRAKTAGVSHVFVPAIDLASVQSVMDTCKRYPGFAFPMVGLHPEEVKADYAVQLDKIKQYITPNNPFIAIGEVGLDFYWSREFEKEQLQAFEAQVKWSVETGLPLMIHCRKAQNEMVPILKKYENELPGGVFHCFTGNENEARQLLQFHRFALGIGGVLTFKKSHLPEVLPAAVPLNRLVIETDAPYMAPVPHRGQRNESVFAVEVLNRLAQCYNVPPQEVATITNHTVAGLFPKAEL